MRGRRSGLLIGFWWFTTPEPNRPGMSSDLDVRRFLRVGVCLLVLTVPAGWVLRVGPAIQLILLLTQFLGFVSCNIAMLTYLRRLALRIPDDKEARAAKMLMIWFLVDLAFTVPGALGSGPVIGTGCFIAVGGCVDTVLIIVFVLFLDRFRKALDGLAQKAEKRLARPAPSTEDSSLSQPTTPLD